MLLSSCGQNNPANLHNVSSQITNTNNPTKSGLSSIPFALTSPPVEVMMYSNASIANSPVIITWNKYPTASSYNLHYATTPNFTNEKIVNNVISPCTYQFDNPDKDYYFFLTAIINNEEKRISPDCRSVVYFGKRYNIVDPFSIAYYNQLNSSSSSPKNISALVSPGIPIDGSLQINVTYNRTPQAAIWVAIGGGGINGTATWVNDPVSGVSMPSTNITTQGTGESLQITNSGLTYTNNNPAPGGYTILASGFDVSTPIYWNKGNSYYLIWDYASVVPDTIEATINGKSVAKISGPYIWFNRLNFELVAITKNKKPKSIAITPTNATIYIHHTDPLKRKQQYTAMGTYDDNGIITTENITNSVDWYSSMPERAYMDNVAGIGTALANVSPGITEIHATSLLPAPDNIQSNIAKLKIACWEYRYWMQNDVRWSNVLYASYTASTTPCYSIGSQQVCYGTIGGTGCLMTDISMAILTTGTWSQPDNLNSDMKRDGYYIVNEVNEQALAKYSNGAIKSAYYADKYTINAELDNCNFVIVAIPSSNGSGNHWVYITGYKEGTDIYYILNPANSTKTEITFDQIKNTGNTVLIGNINF